MIGTVVEANRVRRQQALQHLVGLAEIGHLRFPVERQLELATVDIEFAFVPKESDAVAADVNDLNAGDVAEPHTVLSVFLFGRDNLDGTAVIEAQSPMRDIKMMRAP